MNLSYPSRVAVVVGIIFGFFYQLVTQGWPMPAPVPGADVADALLGPVTTMVWNLVGYFLKALVFGAILALALKFIRSILQAWIFSD